MPKGNVIDSILAKELSGREKLKALFKSKGHTYQSFAQTHGLWPEQVRMTLHGTRPYPEIRQVLADDLGLSLAELDGLVDEAVEAAS